MLPATSLDTFNSSHIMFKAGTKYSSHTQANAQNKQQTPIIKSRNPLSKQNTTVTKKLTSQTKQYHTYP